MPLVSKLPMSGKKSLILPDNANITGVYSYDGELKVQWDVPKGSEIPIDHFNLYWVKADEKPTSLKQFTNKMEISVDATEVTLTGLEDQAKYWLTLESVSDDGFENASLRKANTGSTGETFFIAPYVRQVNSSTKTNGLSYMKSVDGKVWSVLNNASFVQGPDTNVIGSRKCEMAFRRDGAYILNAAYNYGIYKVVNYSDFISFNIGSGGSGFILDDERWAFANGTTVQGLEIVSVNGMTIFAARMYNVSTSKYVNKILYMLDSVDEFHFASMNTEFSSVPFIGYVNGLFYAFRDNNLITSSDGINWNDDNIINTGAVITSRQDGIVYFNGRYITEQMYYSVDGKNWISFKVANSNGVAITVFNGKVFIYYTVNSSYYCIYSDDGINWSEQTNSYYFFYNVSNKSHKNGVLTLAGGTSNVMLYSINGIDTILGQFTATYPYPVSYGLISSGYANTFQ